MANKLIRKKPGYTRSGEVKIISLSVRQLTELKEKTQLKKKQAKIQRRIDLLKRRPGYKEPLIGTTDQISSEQS
jgi:hypothetical protein